MKAVLLIIILYLCIPASVYAYDVPYHHGNDTYWDVDPDTGIATPIGTVQSSGLRDCQSGKVLTHGIDYGWDLSVLGGKFWIKR